MAIQRFVYAVVGLQLPDDEGNAVALTPYFTFDGGVGGLIGVDFIDPVKDEFIVYVPGYALTLDTLAEVLTYIKTHKDDWKPAKPFVLEG